MHRRVVGVEESAPTAQPENMSEVGIDDSAVAHDEDPLSRVSGDDVFGRPHHTLDELRFGFVLGGPQPVTDFEPTRVVIRLQLLDWHVGIGCAVVLCDPIEDMDGQRKTIGDR